MADVTVIIDGIKVQVPDGTYMIDAAQKIGIDIPNFCYLPGLRAFGACRMCVGGDERPQGLGNRDFLLHAGQRGDGDPHPDRARSGSSAI